MSTFGFETFVSILLPGAVLSISGWLIFHAYFDSTIVYAWLGGEPLDIFLTAFVLVSSSLLGMLCASICEEFEWQIMDHLRGKKLKLTRMEFVEQWFCYVEDKTQYPYMERMAITFLFELRTAPAVFILFITVVTISGFNLGSLLLLALSLLLLLLLSMASRASLAPEKDAEPW